MSLALSLHVLCAVIWVGGMFFAYMILRPVAAELLDQERRLQLWRRNFERFFPWVWGAVVILLATGYWIIFQFYGGMAHAGVHIHIMHGLGIVMMLIFLHIYFAPFNRLKNAVNIKDYENGARSLNQIRMFIGFNLLLGLIVIVVATGGKYL